MKKTIFSLILVVFTLFGQAQLQSYVKFTPNSTEWNENVYGEHTLSRNLSLNYFLLVEQNWSEALVGTAYKVSENISLSLMAGLEQNPNIWRLSGFVFASKNDWNLFLDYEQGGGDKNYWYKASLIKKLPYFSIGMMSWRFNLTGLYLEKNITKDLSIWTNVGRDFEFEENRVIVGLNFSL